MAFGHRPLTFFERGKALLDSSREPMLLSELILDHTREQAIRRARENDTLLARKQRLQARCGTVKSDGRVQAAFPSSMGAHHLLSLIANCQQSSAWALRGPSSAGRGRFAAGLLKPHHSFNQGGA
jgi:hypothetical protein